jgi:hypothetical protein
LVWAWWYTLEIPATWKEDIGGLQFEARPGKSMRPYLKNKLNKKGIGHVTQVVKHSSTSCEFKTPVLSKISLKILNLSLRFYSFVDLHSKENFTYMKC